MVKLKDRNTAGRNEGRDVFRSQENLPLAAGE
jgi:hypothetical protein